ncbi:MAG TPA: hypothetical protein DEQ30_04915 [Porphyromonadaceae bacterium]|nr:hypothetical protein [Porphyromonadaceae bacterium]
MVTTEDLYKKTNNGLDIIYYFYPQARECVEGIAKHFKKRSDERTPSATIKQISGVWKVTDFGDDGRAISPIDICMQEKNLSFTEALFFLAREFNVDDNVISKDINKAKIQKRPATEDEEDGHFNYELNSEFTKTELLELGPKVRQSDCDILNWNSVKWYSITKKGETTIITATETYPIFMRKCQYYEPDGKTLNHFYKVYQPLSPDKGFRFFYKGEKPQKYVNGLFELKAFYEKYNEQLEKEWELSDKRKDGDVFKAKKIEEAFFCSGERDALCIHALNYSPLWFNSETYNLSESEYIEITKYVDRLYNIPDVDSTGIRRGIELASKFIDIYTVWLPERLKTYKDRRGNPRKDLRDFCEVWPEKKRFRDLLNMAMPFRFWEYKKNEKGQRRLDLVTDYAMHFLRCNGFHSLEDKNAKSGKMFVRIESNIVREIKSKDIRAYFRKFVRDRYMPIDIRDLVNNTTKLSETSLDNLDEVEVDFTNYTPRSQFFFFKNAIWEASAEKITEHKPGTINRYVWESELMEHNVKRLEPAFEIKKVHNKDGVLSWDIQVSEKHNSNFFRYLINTSRMFWRKELENPRLSPEELEEYRKKYKFVIDGPELSDIEIAEQKHHLVNKIFCLGYLMHRYKAENRSWCIYAMDNKEGSIEESNGGTGKSFCFKTPRLFMQSVTLSGRNPKMTENKHIFENVTEHTKYILVDDADAYTPFSFFFDIVTGDLTVNPKNTKSYTIPFERSPKFCITSNFVLRNIDPSTSRRILYAVFSDYYHEKTDDNGYKETRTIYDDFQKNLFREGYTEYEWNADINFLVECCQFYLSVIKDDIKLQPPMANVISRNLRGIMGEGFLDWAQVYFNEQSGNCNKLLPRQEVFDDFKTVSGLSKWTPHKFTKALKAYCDYDRNIMTLNPEEFRGTDGRIIKQYNGKATEMFYVQTNNELNIELEYNEPGEMSEIHTNIPY